MIIYVYHHVSPPLKYQTSIQLSADLVPVLVIFLHFQEDIYTSEMNRNTRSICLYIYMYIHITIRHLHLDSCTYRHHPHDQMIYWWCCSASCCSGSSPTRQLAHSTLWQIWPIFVQHPHLPYLSIYLSISKYLSISINIYIYTPNILCNIHTSFLLLEASN